MKASFTFEIPEWMGLPVCKNETSCRFLGFRKFGFIPVCMFGEQKDLEFYDKRLDGFIKPNCEFVKEVKE